MDEFEYLVALEGYLVTPSRLRELIGSEIKLRCLENGGVDNWEWYSDSLDEYRKWLGEDDE